MPAPRVRADHDSLRLIAQAMGQQSEASRRTLDRLRRAKEALQGGDWIGVDAKAFYREMDSEILPSMGRLVSALERSAEVTRTISQIMKQAEDEAARLFQLVGAAAATAVAGGGAGGPAPAPGPRPPRRGGPPRCRQRDTSRRICATAPWIRRKTCTGPSRPADRTGWPSTSPFPWRSRTGRAWSVISICMGPTPTWVAFSGRARPASPQTGPGVTS